MTPTLLLHEKFRFLIFTSEWYIYFTRMGFQTICDVKNHNPTSGNTIQIVMNVQAAFLCQTVQTSIYTVKLKHQKWCNQDNTRRKWGLKSNIDKLVLVSVAQNDLHNVMKTARLLVGNKFSSQIRFCSYYKHFPKHCCHISTTNDLLLRVTINCRNIDAKTTRVTKM